MLFLARSTQISVPRVYAFFKTPHRILPTLSWNVSKGTVSIWRGLEWTLQRKTLLPPSFGPLSEICESCLLLVDTAASTMEDYRTVFFGQAIHRNRSPDHLTPKQNSMKPWFSSTHNMASRSIKQVTTLVRLLVSIETTSPSSHMRTFSGRIVLPAIEQHS